MAFECNKCPATYSHRQSLDKHKRNKHKIEVQLPTKPSPVPENQEALGKSRRQPLEFRCEQCDQKFPSKKILTTHQGRRHRNIVSVAHSQNASSASGDKEVLCDRCGCVFQSDMYPKHECLKFRDPKNPLEQLAADYSDMSDDESSLSEAESRALYEIIDISKVDAKELGVYQTTKTIRLSKAGLEFAARGLLYETLQVVLQDLTADIVSGPPSKVQVHLDSTNLEFPINSAFVPSNTYTHEHLLDQLEAVNTSGKNVGGDNDLIVRVITVPIPTVSAAVRVRDYNTSDYFELKKRYSLWDPNNDGTSCFARCVAAGLLAFGDARYCKKLWYRSALKTSGVGKFKSRAMEEKLAWIYSQTGLSPAQATSEHDYAAYDGLLECLGFQLQVFDFQKQNKLIFAGNKKRTVKRRINVALAYGHAFFIRNLSGYLEGRKFCEACNKFYFNKHACTRKNQCYVCRSAECRSVQESRHRVYCTDCSRYTMGLRCFQIHKEKNICGEYKSCQKCLKVVYQPEKEEHDLRKCGMYECKNCKETKCVLNGDHYCYVQKPSKRLSMPEKASFVFYDLETYTCPSTKRLIPYLASTLRLCHNCFYRPDVLSPCLNCGQKERDWYGISEVQNFFDWALHDECNKKAIFIAQNAARFDTNFILSYAIEKGETPKVVSNGSKLILLKCGKSVTFKDFFLFCQCALRNLPSTFGMDEGKFRKGDFCIFFPQKAQDLKYVGDIPAAKFFPKPKTPRDLAAFTEFYNERKESLYDFEKEARAYCRQDTLILAQAAVKFSSTYRKFGIEPLGASTTIAHLTSLLLRECFLPEFTLGLCPELGYSLPMTRKQSLIATKFIDFYQHCRPGCNILREHRINGGRHVDGFWEERNLVIMVQGCLFHSCMDCYRNRGAPHPLHKTATFADCYDHSQRELDHIRLSGYKLKVVWEHEIRNMVRRDPEMREYFNQEYRWWHLADPITPRSALRGGRTAPNSLCMELTDEEIKAGITMDLVDFQSLYPACQRNYLYPKGHPVILSGEQLVPYQDLTPDLCSTDLFGLISCTILPNNKLENAVLGVEINGSFEFPNCYTCHKLQARACTHSEKERALKGVWVSEEIRLALENGYRVLHLHECWKYEERTDQIFKKFVEEIITQKVVSSGFPSDTHCVSGNCDQKKGLCDQCEECLDKQQEYIDSWLNELGIVIPKNDVKFNASYRSVAKMSINSAWGKLCEKLERTNRMYFHSQKELLDVIKKNEVTNVHIFNNAKTGVVFYKEDKALCGPNGKEFYNPIVASFCTAYGRIELYKVLKILGKNALYYDTDSCLYKRFPGAPEPPRGLLLGQLQSELPPHCYIRCFVSCAPKMYAFVVCNMRHESVSVTVKAKGVSLTSECKEILNYDTLKSFILLHCSDLGVDSFLKIYEGLPQNEKERLMGIAEKSGGNVIVVPNPCLKIHKWAGTIHSFPRSVKILRFNFKKRKILLPISNLNNIPTVPYGYQAG